METPTLLFMLPAALIVGFFAAWLWLSAKLNHVKENAAADQLRWQREWSMAENKHLVANETLRLKAAELDRMYHEFAQLSQLSDERSMELAGLQIANANLMEKLQTQKQDIEELQKRLTVEFENIASKIMKERADDFSESSHKNLNLILDPLKEKISLFEKKVEDTYDKELRDKISLKEEIVRLTELNARVSNEANNLTKALKGDMKKQGNWGEVILERVLERSGLTKGQEYDLQVDVTSHEDHRQRPDVIVHLPDEKHIIIDSKVSLNAYEQYISAENPEEQSFQLKKHIVSLRSHIKELSDKNYQQAVNVNTPDFVLLFLPIEASFSVALQYDNELYTYAWERKVVIVSPTTLLATLRTISSIWRQENQTKNAQEIARLSKALYDKFLAFAEDMDRIKISLDRASGAYSEALKKMKDGKGNMIRTAERIQELGGFDSQKSLPTDFEFF